jgi:H(+)-translocating pyrophosphatase
MNEGEITFLYISVSAGICILFAYVNRVLVKRVPIKENPVIHINPREYLREMLQNSDPKKKSNNPYKEWSEVSIHLKKISKTIKRGSNQFLLKKLWITLPFTVIFTIILSFIPTELLDKFWYTFPFLIGISSTILAEFISTKIALESNSRVAYSSVNKENGAISAFKVGIRSSAIISVFISSFCILHVIGLIWIYNHNYLKENYTRADYTDMYCIILSYALGCSLVASVSRITGAIYSKSADIGTDIILQHKLVLTEDDPSNPAVISDLIGDNISGISSDLYFCLAGTLCFGLWASSESPQIAQYASSLYYPISLQVTAILNLIPIISMLSFTIRYLKIEFIKNVAVYICFFCNALLTPSVFLVTVISLPMSVEFVHGDQVFKVTRLFVFFCVMLGLWLGPAIGLVMHHYTSDNKGPTGSVINSSRTGAATGIIFGLSLGYISCASITILLAVSLYFTMSNLYTISLVGIGCMLNITSSSIMNFYTNITDTAYGMINLLNINSQIKNRLEKLCKDARKGNAISKGIELANTGVIPVLFVLGLLHSSKIYVLDILTPLNFCALLVGSMIPYGASAIVIRSIAKTATEVFLEISLQLTELDSESNYVTNEQNFIIICSKAGVRRSIPTICLLLALPITAGFVFGVEVLSALLIGLILSGWNVGCAGTVSGMSWHNALKHFISLPSIDNDQTLRLAGITTDLVGDALKDALGPFVSILLKSTTVASFTLAPIFHTLA